MERKMFVQSSFYWVLYYAGTMFSANKAHAIAASCLQVYPSEYAYEDISVAEEESISASCRSYQESLQEGVFTEQYTHCDGTQLKLIDSDLGQGQYQIADYYVWLDGSDAQLLFIFSTRVSLTTITLHYYSDSVQGLPRLTFYAVPDDFDVWNIPTTSYPRVDVASVAPGRGSSRKSISINVNFNTKKLLMYKFSSNIALAVSEVEFITCTPAITTVTASILIATNDPTTSAKNESSNMTTESNIMENGTNFFISNTSTITSFTTYKLNEDKVPPNITTRIVAIGVSIVILLILSTIFIIVIVLILSYKKRSAKQNLYTDCSYSTLSRASGPQTRTRSTQENSSELYDQIHLSPSTGQTEYYIPKIESAKINNPCTTPQNSHPIYSTAGKDIAEHSATLNATTQETSAQLSLQIAHESTSEQPTYAAVDKSKKKKFKAGEKGPPVSSCAGHSSSAQKEKENTTKQDIHSPHTIEELYTAVKKKEKVCEPKDEEEAPPIPPHTVEELYTAVQKKLKGRSNADGNKDDHNIPPHKVEEVYVGEKPLQITKEDPYTAVTKKQKDGSTENTETAPPIPPHTVEELYTAVMKTPKSAAKEEKAPPKPPFMVDKN